MKKTATILAALAMSAATASAGVAPAYAGKNPPPPPPPAMDPCAGPISYNNIELLYANTDWGFGGSSDGAILRAEYSPMQNFYLAASVAWTDVDSGGFVGGIEDLWDFTIGVGGYFPLTDNIHLAADVGYAHQRYDQLVLDNSGGTVWDSQSDGGWYARPHLRGKWGCLTVHAGAMYRNLDVDDDVDDDFFDGGDWAYYVQLYYQLTSNWDVTAGYLNGEHDFEQWSIGARYRY